MTPDMERQVAECRKHLRNGKTHADLLAMGYALAAIQEAGG